jgi:hypothetical protein
MGKSAKIRHRRQRRALRSGRTADTVAWRRTKKEAGVALATDLLHRLDGQRVTQEAYIKQRKTEGKQVYGAGS